MFRTHEQNGKIKVVATVISVLVIGGTVITADKLKSHVATVSTLGTSSAVATSTTSISAASTPSTSSGQAPTASGSLKDGTYTASASYDVPHGQESISVTAKLTSGVISSISIENSEGDRDSASYQADFASSYKNYVVGKSISGLNLSVISGASDTTAGFEQALSSIASQAQA